MNQRRPKTDQIQKKLTESGHQGAYKAERTRKSAPLGTARGGPETCLLDYGAVPT